MIDIRHTPDGDINIQADNLVYAEPTLQHQRDILIGDKGHFKESPTVGVGAINYVHDTEPTIFLRAIRKEFSRDGMKVRGVGFVNDELIIDADYEDN